MLQHFYCQYVFYNHVLPEKIYLSLVTDVETFKTITKKLKMYQSSPIYF